MTELFTSKCIIALGSTSFSCVLIFDFYFAFHNPYTALQIYSNV